MAVYVRNSSSSFCAFLGKEVVARQSSGEGLHVGDTCFDLIASGGRSPHRWTAGYHHLCEALCVNYHG